MPQQKRFAPLLDRW